jgi:DinB superfamily
MRRVAFVLLIAFPLALSAQDNNKKPPTTLRGVLLEQLRTTHTDEDWFVPANIAVQGLTADQAKWTPPGNGNHSVGQLAYHIWFWDTQALARFKGEKPPAFGGNNDETFNDFNAAQWDDLVKKLNQVMTDWEEAVSNADDQKLADNASLVAHVGAHNAYHIGQIIYVRKLQGAWDASKGVK